MMIENPFSKEKRGYDDEELMGYGSDGLWVKSAPLDPPIWVENFFFG